MTSPRSVRGSATRLTGRGWLLLVAAVVCVMVAYVQGRSGLLYSAGFLAALPLFALVLVRVRRLRLSVERTFTPEVIAAGEPAVVDLSVLNLSPSASNPATWADHLPWAPGTAGPGQLPSLGAAARGYTVASSALHLGYSLRPPRRGIYRIGPLSVEYGDPFGLVTGRAALGGVQPLFVTPAVSSLGEGGPLVSAGEGAARLIQRHAAGNDDDLMTREYRSGDALRRVHWRASARHGELMVRQEEQRTYPEARLIVDTLADGYVGTWSLGEDEDGGANAAFEWAVRMVASLGVHLHRAGFLVEVSETARRQIGSLGDGSQGLGQDVDFLRSLAGVRLMRANEKITTIEDDGPMGGMAGPVFAVLSHPRPEVLAWIRMQRRPSELGVAFVVGNHPEAAVDALAAAGWVCVPASASQDPAEAWANVSAAAVTAR